MKYIAATIVVGMSVCMYGCGTKSEEQEVVVADSNLTGKTDPVDYTKLNYTDAQLDSIAVYGVDFVSPGEGAGLLLYYHNKIVSASGTKKEQLKRMYKDMYDILKGNYGGAMTTAIEKARRFSGVDLTAAYEEYAGLLATADDGGTYIREKMDTATLTEDVMPEGVTDAEVSESDGFIIVSPTASGAEEE